MKKIVFLSALLIFSWQLFAQSQEQEYVKAMESTLQALNQASELQSLQQIANTFERISASEPTQWLPNYHTAFVYTLIASKAEIADKDKYLDRADEFILKAENVSQQNDEIEALKGFVYLVRMTVDPQARGMKYAGLFYKVIGTAKKINPENPRPYGLQSLMIFNTPEQFGGGINKACPEIKKCSEKFAAFKPASSVHPQWGLEQAQKMAEKCL